MKKLSLVLFFVLIGALSYGALMTDYDITSGPKASVYDLGDATLKYSISGADLIAGNSGAIVGGSFHGATQPADDPSRLASITDSLFAANGLTVIANDYGYANYDLVIEYTLAMPANVTDILIFSGHDGDGSRAWINADVMIDSGGGMYTLYQNLKTGPYGQAVPGNTAVAVVRLFDNSPIPFPRIAGSVQKIRIGFYCVSNSFVDGSFQPPGADGINGTIIKEIDVLGYEDMGVKINEVSWDSPSTDTEEFIELFGPGSMPLTGWTLELVNGYNGLPYTPSPIPLTAIPADGYLVLSYSPPSCPNQDIAVVGFTVQNGSPDAIRLKDPLGAVQDAFGYEMRPGGPYALTKGTDYEGPGFWASSGNHGWQPTDYSCQRVTDGYDTDDNERDFALLGTTPGMSNQTSKGHIPYANDFDDAAGTQYGEWWGYWVDMECNAPGGTGLPPVASPQGGNFGVPADTAGGYDSTVLADRATTDVSVECYIYLRETTLPTGDAEEGAFQVRGSTDIYHNTGAYNADKGIVWWLAADDSGSTLSLQERYAGQILQTLIEVPVSGGFTGWKRIRVDCIGNSVMGVFGGNLGDTGGDIQVFGTTTYPAGGIGFSYQEFVTSLADASFLSIDAIRINNAPGTVVPVELSLFQIE
jgi:hypothetical protein